MPLNTFEPGLVADRVTGKPIVAATGVVHDGFTGDPVTIYSTEDDVTPITLSTNRFGVFSGFRADAAHTYLTVRFAGVTLTRLAVELLAGPLIADVENLGALVAELVARIEALEAGGVGGGGTGDLTVSDPGTGILSTTSLDVSDPGTGILSTTSTVVSDPGTGTLTSAA